MTKKEWKRRAKDTEVTLDQFLVLQRKAEKEHREFEQKVEGWLEALLQAPSGDYHPTGVEKEAQRWLTTRRAQREITRLTDEQILFGDGLGTNIQGIQGILGGCDHTFEWEGTAKDIREILEKGEWGTCPLKQTEVGYE